MGPDREHAKVSGNRAKWVGDPSWENLFLLFVLITNQDFCRSLPPLLVARVADSRNHGRDEDNPNTKLEKVRR